MRKIYIVYFLISLSCSNNDQSGEKSTIDSTFKRMDSIKKAEILKIKPLPNNLGYKVDLVDEETYNKAVDKGIKFVRDTSDFKKVGNRLELYSNSKKVFEFIDSANALNPDTGKSWDNVEYRAEGYYIINGKKWYRAMSAGYEWGTIILIPPPYNKTYGVSSEPIISGSGTYLFDLFFTGLGGFKVEWSLYNIANDKLKKKSSHNLDCSCANNDIKSNRISILCPQTKEAKWISDKELLLKISNYEGDDKARTGYVKLTIN